MMAIALGVLLLTAAVTAGLARRSEASSARHDVEQRAEAVGPEFDTKTLLAGKTQKGRDGNTVFVARPLAPVNGTTPVVVLSEDVNTRPFGGSGFAVLAAAALALGIAALVAAYLARRMTEPLAAMETTARSIAGGDLGARVDTSQMRDDELANLAHTINAMAGDLDLARG